MDSSTLLLGRLADDLKPFQRFKTDAGLFLERRLNEAAREVYQAKDWSFKTGSFELPTTGGTLGPYSIPESVTDFDGLLREERLSAYFAYDTHSQPRIPDDEVGRRFEVTYNRSTGKLHFPYSPGTGTLTLYYRKKYGGLDTFSAWPDKLETPVCELAAFYALHKSVGQDAKAKAVEFFNNAQRLLKEAWLDDRAGHSLQEGREPRGALGSAIYYGFQED